MERIVLEMKTTRDVVSRGLEARQKLKIQVRQPLKSITTKVALSAGLRAIIGEELNVKEVIQNKDLEQEVSIDTEITPELKMEGDYRELVRGLQDMRKSMGLTPNEGVSIVFETSASGQALIEKFKEDLKKAVAVSGLEFAVNDGETLKAGELEFKVKIQKQNA